MLDVNHTDGPFDHMFMPNVEAVGPRFLVIFLSQTLSTNWREIDITCKNPSALNTAHGDPNIKSSYILYGNNKYKQTLNLAIHYD